MQVSEVQMDIDHGRHRVWAIAPLLAGALIVIYWIVLGNRYSLWVDEAFSVRMSRLPWRDLVDQVTVNEGNMGPYYIALWGWEKILPGARWARALSVIGSLFTIWAIWVMVRKHAGALIAASAVLVFAVNPFVLGWSIEARGFTIVMATSAWALVLADSLVREGRRLRAIQLGILTGVTVATLLSTFLVFVGVFFAILIRSRTRRTIQNLLIASSVAAGAFSPFAYAFLTNREQVRWIAPFTTDQFLRESTRFLGGLPTAVVYAVAVGVLVVGSAFVKTSRRFLVPGTLVVLAAIGLAMFSVWIQPLFVSRYLAGAAPLVTLTVVGSCAVFVGRAQRIAVGLLVTSCALVTSIWNANALPHNEDYRWAVSVIESDYRPGDGVATFPNFAMNALLINWDSPPEDLLIVVGVSETNKLLVRGARTESYAPQRIWLVTRGKGPTYNYSDDSFGRLMKAYPKSLDFQQRGYITVHLLGL